MPSRDRRKLLVSVVFSFIQASTPPNLPQFRALRPAQRPRGAAIFAADRFVEALEVGEPDLHGDLLDAARRVLKQVVRPLEAAAALVGLHGLLEAFMAHRKRCGARRGRCAT